MQNKKRSWKRIKRTYTHYGMEPFATEPEAFCRRLQSFGIVGLQIKDIRLTGQNMNLEVPERCRSFTEYQTLPEKSQAAIRKCYAETDHPLLIRLADDRILALHTTFDTDAGEFYYVGMDTLPWENPEDDWWQEPIADFDPPNCNAGVLFGRTIGMQISGFNLNVTFGDSQPRINGFALELLSCSPPLERLELTVEDWVGYSLIALKDGAGVVSLPEAALPALFAGYEDRAKKR